MNKLFKVIWSKSKQCYIVVSEVAKNTTGKKKIAVASVLAALAVSAQVATVQAAIPEGEATNGAALAIGNNVKVSNDSSTGLGKDIEVTRRFAVAVDLALRPVQIMLWQLDQVLDLGQYKPLVMIVLP